MSDLADLRFTKRVDTRLWALRHLVGGTVLPAPICPDERALSVELLQLPDSVSAEWWMLRQHPSIVPTICLRRALAALKDAVRAFTETGAPAPFGPSDTNAGRWLENLKAGTPLGSALATFDACGVIDTIDFLQFAHQLRSVLPISGRLPEPLEQQQELRLLRVLLDRCLAPDCGTLQDCITERVGVLAADIVLKQLIDSCTPSPPVPVLVTDRVALAKRQASFAPLELTLDELALGTNSFLLDASARVDLSEVPIYGGPARRLVSWWDGFDQVEDDLGHSYICWPMFEGSREAGRLQHLQFVCYPALVPTATAVEFRAIQTYLRVIGLRVHQEPITFPDIMLGDVRVALPLT